jgi:hypothetical protein
LDIFLTGLCEFPLRSLRESNIKEVAPSGAILFFNGPWQATLNFTYEISVRSAGKKNLMKILF